MYYKTKATEISLKILALSMENKKKVRGSHSGLLWFRQCVHVEVKRLT